jgi:D-alanyl-D-alanine carboxypeptidase
VQAVGVSDLATGAPMALDDAFRIASVTKTFTATVVLQLVDEGKLTLDDLLEQYVTGIPNGDRITIRQVLGMTAGIYNYVEDPASEKAYSADPLMPSPPRTPSPSSASIHPTSRRVSASTTPIRITYCSG